MRTDQNLAPAGAGICGALQMRYSGPVYHFIRRLLAQPEARTRRRLNHRHGWAKPGWTARRPSHSAEGQQPVPSPPLGEAGPGEPAAPGPVPVGGQCPKLGHFDDTVSRYSPPTRLPLLRDEVTWPLSVPEHLELCTSTSSPTYKSRVASESLGLALPKLIASWASREPRMAGEYVLVVDDNASNRFLLESLLESEGYEVRGARNAEEVLGELQALHPRVILMNMQLPGTDGFELTRRIKSAPATRDIVVIAVTAYAMKGDEQRALDAGCDGYVSKPIDTRTLGATIAGYVHGR